MEIHDREKHRKHTAYHEAGHVIADLFYGYRFTFVTIRPEESEEYEGVVHGSTRGRARNLAVVQLAGIVASAKVGGYDPWADPPRFDDDSADIATADRFIDNWGAFLTKTYGEASYGEQLWSEAEDMTRNLVDGNWNAIEVIAQALMEKETLTYEDVVRILKDRCPSFILGKQP